MYEFTKELTNSYLVKNICKVTNNSGQVRCIKYLVIWNKKPVQLSLENKLMFIDEN